MTGLDSYLVKALEENQTLVEQLQTSTTTTTMTSSKSTKTTLLKTTTTPLVILQRSALNYCIERGYKCLSKQKEMGDIFKTVDNEVDCQKTCFNWKHCQFWTYKWTEKECQIFNTTCDSKESSYIDISGMGKTGCQRYPSNFGSNCID